jgi:hypothetical protein
MNEVFDSWSAYEYPTLVAIARRAENAREYMQVPSDNLLEELTASSDDRYKFERGLVRLEKHGYIRASEDLWGKPYPRQITGITERGLRAVGAWPNPSSVVDAVLQRLEEQANAIAVSQPEKSTRLKEVVRFFTTAGRDVLVNVISGVASKAAGLP